MGRSVKPSCMNTTGIGPAIDRRRARRTGTDAVPVRAMRAAGVGHSPPIKKPAAMDAAGFDQGHGSGVRRRAFQRRTVRLRPPLAVAGGVACRAAGFRVVLAHSLPQGTSAGRNLITVFSTVNNLSQSFSMRARAALPATREGACDMHRSRSPANPSTSMDRCAACKQWRGLQRVPMQSRD